MDEPGLSEEERQLWDQLESQLADVHARGTRQARLHLRAQMAAFVVLVLGTLGALWWWPLALCFPAAALAGTRLWERHHAELVERVGGSLRR